MMHQIIFGILGLCLANIEFAWSANDISKLSDGIRPGQVRRSRQYQASQYSFPRSQVQVVTEREPYSTQNPFFALPQVPQLPSGTGSYPIVITPRHTFQGEHTAVSFTYRPTQLEYTLPETVTVQPPQRPRRPVITVGSNSQLPYGRPYIRVPSSEKQIAPIQRRPIRPNPLPDNFGPITNSAPLTIIKEDPDEYPTFISTPYAPSFTNYIPSLYFRHTQNPRKGDYDFEFDTANGIYQKESGFMKRISIYNPITRGYEEKDVNVKTGTVSWTSPEGIPFSYSYIADEKGYRPTPLVQSTQSLAAAAMTTGVNPYKT